MRSDTCESFQKINNLKTNMAYIMTKVILLVVFLKNVQSSTTVQCGFPRINKNEVILHADETIPGAWPWHAAIYHRKRISDAAYACGGTLVSPKFVITSAHCVIGENRMLMSNNVIFVRLGVHNLGVLDSSSMQQHSIWKVYKHANYSGDQVWNDIAILELATEAVFNNYVQPACLGLTHNLTGLFGTVIGWGTTENGEISPTLRSARMPVIDFYTCLESNRELFGNTLSRETLCAGYTNGTTICNGDSGGGLFFQHKNAWYLGGVVSYTGIRSFENRLCDKNSFGGFSNVQTYLPWITSITGLQFEDAVNVCNVKDDNVSEVHKNLLPSDCGTPTPNIGSNLTNPSKHLWMAILHYNMSNSSHTPFSLYCEGSLISNRYVLTAGQCVKRQSLPFKVTLGDYNIFKNKKCKKLDGVYVCKPPILEYGIECILRHRNYSTPTFVNDIALLRLAKEVTFTDHVKPICLPVAQLLSQLNPVQFAVNSWIRSNYTLAETMVEQVDRKYCKNIDLFTIEENQLRPHCMRRLIEEDGVILRKGAPLGTNVKYKDATRYVQFGILSAKYTFKLQYPFLYTDVTDYIGWIMANLNP